MDEKDRAQAAPADEILIDEGEAGTGTAGGLRTALEDGLPPGETETKKESGQRSQTAPVRSGKGEKAKKRKKKRGGKKILIFLLIVAAALGCCGYYWKTKQAAAAASTKTSAVQTAKATRQDIASELTASSSLSPKDTYEITSLVEGEIVEADFEEGDVVEKGQILYRIDTSTMETEMTSARNSVTRAQSSLTTAQEDYDEAASKFSGNTYKATETGYVKTLYVKAGDKVGSNTKIADIYDDSVMKLRVPFLTAEAAQIPVGSQAVVTLEDTDEEIGGTVTAVSNMEETLAGGRIVRYVTIEVANPGGLTAEMQAVASVGEFLCGEDGTFEPTTETVMNADISSGSLEVESMLISEGDFINKGTPLFTATGASMEKVLRSYQDALDKAKETLESAQNKMDSTVDNIEDYTITAPISGTVISKTMKVGDKVTRSSGSAATAMAVIYDLSAMSFEMSVDELDVNKVKVGQTVEITADAVEGEQFTGTVSNVSLQSSYSNGVTNYPVTVVMTETGSLLPGMNVDGTIILESSEAALVIPSGSLMRGNRVYVRDDSETEQRGDAPDGFRAVEVTTGVINDDFVEVLTGLSEGDEVYVDPNAGKTATETWQTFTVGPGGPGGMQGGGMQDGGRNGGRR